MDASKSPNLINTLTFGQAMVYLLLLPPLYFIYMLLARHQTCGGVPRAGNDQGWVALFQSKFWVESRQRSIMKSAYIKASITRASSVQNPHNPLGY
ncbi:hypothetical protein E4U54_004288 [Claviceps lovelessii]|nr:hypothetical protein E4U54_004288 [Claviceps lovelessii]